MSDKIDMKISGSSVMPGGEYGKVSISGSGKIQGSVKCDRLACSGSGKVAGDVVAQTVACSGAAQVEGSLDCREKLSTSGSFSCTGAIQAQEIHCSGSFHAKGKVAGGDFRISGAFQAEQGVHCRDFRASGACQVQGDLEAGMSGSVVRRTFRACSMRRRWKSAPEAFPHWRYRRQHHYCTGKSQRYSHLWFFHQPLHVPGDYVDRR